MKWYKSTSILIIMSVMIIAFGNTDARAATITKMTGTVGEQSNITWKLEDGVLTLSGTGKMPEAHDTYGWYRYQIYCAYYNEVDTIVHENEKVYEDWWYDYNNSIQSIVIEEGITSIAAHAFSKLTHVESITIPSTVTKIGHNAFKDSSFRQIIIPDSVKTIEAAAFEHCYRLESVRLPKNLTKIDYALFYDSNIKEITIPAKVKTIENRAFAFCNSLETVNWEGKSSLKKIKYSAFEACNIHTLTIPASVNKISDAEAVNGAQNIKVEKNNKKYKSKDGVLFTKDGKTLLCYPSAKKDSTYKIPKGVKTIESFAFQNEDAHTPHLKKVIMPDSVTVIKQSAFWKAKKLKTVRFSKNLKKIENRAFAFTSLKSLKLPNSLIYIEDYAFVRGKLKGTIVIPKNVEEIGANIFGFDFSDTKGIKKIVVKSKKLYYIQTQDSLKKVSIILPKSKKASYENLFYYLSPKSTNVGYSVDDSEEHYKFQKSVKFIYK